MYFQIVYVSEWCVLGLNYRYLCHPWMRSLRSLSVQSGRCSLYLVSTVAPVLKRPVTIRSAGVSCGTATDLAHKTVGTQTRRELTIGSSSSVQWDWDEGSLWSHVTSPFCWKQAASGSVAPVVDFVSTSESEVVGNGTVDAEETQVVGAENVVSSGVVASAAVKVVGSPGPLNSFNDHVINCYTILLLCDSNYWTFFRSF